MSNLKYPIFKLPEYYIREFEKRELPRYMKWWLYQSYLRKHGVKLSDILTGSNFTLENTVARKFNIFEVGGNTEQTQLTGKNLFDKDKNATNYNGANKTILNTGVRITQIADGESKYVVIKIGGRELLGKTLTISSIIKPSTNNVGAFVVFLGSVSSPAISRIGNFIASTGNETITIPNEFPNNADSVNLFLYTSYIITGEKNDYVDYIDLQIEKGSTATSYEPYCGGIPSPNPSYPQAIKNVTGNVNVKIQNGDGTKEQNLPFTLEEGQKLMLGGSLQDDGIHQIRYDFMPISITGIARHSSGLYYCYCVLPISVNNQKLSDTRSTHFRPIYGVGKSQFYFTADSIVFTLDDQTLTTQEAVNNWLQEQRNNGTPVVFNLILAKEQIVPYTPTQQEQYNAIQKAKTYNEQTNISSKSDGIDPILKIQYYEVKEV